MTFEEMEKEILRLRSLIDGRVSEDIKYRRLLEDIINNLTLENMPSVKKALNGSIEKISQISGDIEGIFAGISSIEQRVNEQGAEISLVVSETEGEKTVNAAGIIAAINNSGSSIKMSADKISFEGSDISIDTDMLTVNSEGRVDFNSPISASAVYASDGYFNGRVDMGDSRGQSGYAYINGNEMDGIEIHGAGGVVLTTEADGKGADGDIEVYADSMRINGYRVLTDSDADLAYIRMMLGNY